MTDAEQGTHQDVDGRSLTGLIERSAELKRQLVAFGQSSHGRRR